LVFDPVFFYLVFCKEEGGRGGGGRYLDFLGEEALWEGGNRKEFVSFRCEEKKYVVVRVIILLVGEKVVMMRIPVESMIFFLLLLLL